MKNKRKCISLISLLLVLVMMLSACGSASKSKNDAKDNGPATTEATTREITDMAGRTLTIPTKITKVMGYNAMAQSMMYTFAPELLSSLGSKPSEGECYFYSDTVKNLPVLGDNSGKRTMNPEEVIAAAPDIILHVTKITDAEISKINEAQAQLNIPIVIVDSTMDTIDKSYSFLGNLVGMDSKGKEYADYARKVMDDVKKRAESIPEENRVKVYYAEGDEGLQTDPEGSDHARAFTAVRALNVAQIADFDANYGRATVSMEQVLEWNPDVVVFCPNDSIFSSNSASICQDLMDGKSVNTWSSVPAVKNGRFYEAPYGLANCIDRPASVNLLYGYRWLGNLLYPEVFDYDMVKITKEFYSMFYHYDMTDDEVEKLLSRSTMKK